MKNPLLTYCLLFFVINTMAQVNPENVSYYKFDEQEA